MNFKSSFVDKRKRFKLHSCDCGILCIDVRHSIVRNKNPRHLIMTHIDSTHRKVVQ